MTRHNSYAMSNPRSWPISPTGGVTQYEPAHQQVWPIPVLSTQPAGTLTYEIHYALAD